VIGQVAAVEGESQSSTTATNYTTIVRGMPWLTPIDRVFNQKALFYTFVGIIVGTTVLTLYTDAPIVGSHRGNEVDTFGSGRSLEESS
jgi:hypothetical protein